LNFTDSLNDREVFNNDTFISLLAVQSGGAIYTKSEASVLFCKFANNSAGNNRGNDIFAEISTSYYGLSQNVNNDCSVSLSPGRIVISTLVC
jgi:predicted outer membrane repeat protein